MNDLELKLQECKLVKNLITIIDENEDDFLYNPDMLTLNNSNGTLVLSIPINGGEFNTAGYISLYDHTIKLTYFDYEHLYERVRKLIKKLRANIEYNRKQRALNNLIEVNLKAESIIKGD